MKRIIKFRAFDKEKKQMYNARGLYVHPNGSVENVWCYDEETGTNWKATALGREDVLESLEIMQFTGLLDKNGKEIYEGDLIELENWKPRKYEVVFNRGGFCLKFGEDSNFYPDIKYAEDSVVIGNIYEHPHLLTN